MSVTSEAAEKHWAGMKAERVTLDPERFSRLRDGRMTRQTDAAAVQAAADDWCDARDEYAAAYRAGSEAIDARTDERTRRAPAYWRYLDAAALAVFDAMHDGHEMTPSRNSPWGRAKTETYPLTRWAKEAACFRRWAKKILAAVAAAGAIPAVAS
jgi:hypothetical protein